MYAPIANFYINIAPPCGDFEVGYTPRIGASRLYEEGSCSFSYEKSKFHPGVLATGFKETEWDVLEDNSYLSKVKSKVPDWQTTDFTSNYYQLYFKPYSTWSYACSHYSTQFVEEQGEQI
mmetsp:Transcript_7249/g.5506  ORF Transcript_7249/g.5506 Transcript_7249/m.5506 type:complete len:120 (+) Transcript_7249:662-1021(+)